MPLQIIYQSKIYRDKVDITPEQIYSGMEREVPKTSLPLTADKRPLNSLSKRDILIF